MVRKFVSVPPSQRFTMKKEPLRAASSWTISCAWRFVPITRRCPPRATVSWTKLYARWKRRAVWSRSMMWMPLRAP